MCVKLYYYNDVTILFVFMVGGREDYGVRVWVLWRDNVVDDDDCSVGGWVVGRYSCGCSHTDAGRGSRYFDAQLDYIILAYGHVSNEQCGNVVPSPSCGGPRPTTRPRPRSNGYRAINGRPPPRGRLSTIKPCDDGVRVVPHHIPPPTAQQRAPPGNGNPPTRRRTPKTLAAHKPTIFFCTIQNILYTTAQRAHTARLTHTLAHVTRRKRAYVTIARRKRSTTGRWGIFPLPSPNYRSGNAVVQWLCVCGWPGAEYTNRD